MSARLSRTLIVIGVILFLTGGAYYFSPAAPRFPTIAALVLIVVATNAAEGGAVAMILSLILTLGLLMGPHPLSAEERWPTGAWLVFLWVANLLLLAQRSAFFDQEQRERRKKEDAVEKTRGLENEIRFYDERRMELAQRAEKRRGLSEAARKIGSLLDPAQIQERLLAAAQRMFAGEPVYIHSGVVADRIDQWVTQKRQAVLSPSDAINGPPLMAVPIMAQGDVAGVLRVGEGGTKRLFNREELRLLDALAGLASLALDNCVLFHHVQQSALRDNLTGLLTHRAFQTELEAAVLAASRYHQPLSVIFADVDHFKSINDSHGHPMGDQVLQAFSHVMDRNVRPVDILARYGGEEFAIILLQTTQEDAMAIADHMRLGLAEQEFDGGRGGFRVTSSFGVATFPDDATSAQQLVREADQRLYAAKRNGRNRVVGRNG